MKINAFNNIFSLRLIYKILLILIILINFFLILSNVSLAQMENFDGCYQATTPPDHYENRYSTLGKTALTSAVNGLVLDGIALAMCNTDCTTMMGGKLSLLESGSQGCQAGFIDKLTGKDGRTYESRGGLAYTTVKVAEATLEEGNFVPMNMALYLGDTLNTNIFSNNTVYAQGSTEVTFPFFTEIAFGIWKMMRNIAISLLALAVGIVAIAIIFKKKLPAQYSVTIFNSIGNIIIAIFFILLSYPFMAFIWSMMQKLTSISTSIFIDLFVGITNIEAMSAIIDVNGEVSIWSLLGGLFYKFDTGSAAGITSQLSLPILAGILAFFTGGAWLWIIIFAFVALLSVFIWLLIYIFIVWRLYIRLIVLTIISPFVGLVSILPGRNGLVLLFLKKAFSEIIFAFYLGFLLIFGIGGYYFLTQDNTLWTDGDVLVKGLTLMLPIFFSWYLLINTAKVRKGIESALGASGGIFEAISSGTGGGEEFKGGKKDFKPRR